LLPRDQALRGEVAERPPKRAAADGEVAAQLGLGRQLGAGRPAAGHDVVGEGEFQLVVQRRGGRGRRNAQSDQLGRAILLQPVLGER
jgi:hypothetical protein